MTKKAYDLRFPADSTHLVVGPSGAGKSYRVAEILRHKHEMIKGGRDITNVVFFYEAWQPLYQQLKDDGVVTRWIQAPPTNEAFVEAVAPYRNHGGSIVVIDDFEKSASSPELGQILRVSSRHYKTVTFVLFQTLFPKLKHAREISLNVKYIHAHKNPRENAQIQYLARQLLPQNYQWFVEAFHAITAEPYSAMLIDCTQETPNYLRYRSHYMPDQVMRLWFAKGHPPPV
jgi:hypothetical protein